MKRCKPDIHTSIMAFILGICFGFLLCHKLYTGLMDKPIFVPIPQTIANLTN